MLINTFHSEWLGSYHEIVTITRNNILRQHSCWRRRRRRPCVRSLVAVNINLGMGLTFIVKMCCADCLAIGKRTTESQSLRQDAQLTGQQNVLGAKSFL